MLELAIYVAVYVLTAFAAYRIGFGRGHVQDGKHTRKNKTQRSYDL